jgi:hypothetical protein
VIAVLTWKTAVKIVKRELRREAAKRGECTKSEE